MRDLKWILPTGFTSIPLKEVGTGGWNSGGGGTSQGLGHGKGRGGDKVLGVGLGEGLDVGLPARKPQ